MSKSKLLKRLIDAIRFSILQIQRNSLTFRSILLSYKSAKIYSVCKINNIVYNAIQPAQKASRLYWNSKSSQCVLVGR